MPRGSATYQQINPVSGLVTNEFDGHISADGVDLLAGTASSPPDDRKVRWLEEGSGGLGLVADVSAYRNPGGGVNNVSLTSRGQTGDSAQAIVEARRAAANEFAGLISVSLPGTPAQDIVQAYVRSGGVDRAATIIDGNGASSFAFSNHSHHIAQRQVVGNSPDMDTINDVVNFPRSKVYTFGYGGTGFQASLGAGAIYLYIDGFFQQQAFLFWNEVEHLFMAPMVSVFLNAGNHTIALRRAGISQDSNDMYYYNIWE